MTLPNFSPILNALSKAQDPLNRLLPKGQGTALGLHLREKSEQNQPFIMVYGYYNAGKSTLLNALMGEAKAAMGDIPLTSTVDAYQWNGYTLLDTPGIDAPIEHEDIANSELDRCDVVLFVLASDGAVEEQATWNAIKSIINRGRGFILIVNNKTGLATGSKDYIALTEKLRARLQKETGVDDIVQSVPIRLIDARAALKGRIENKQKLVEDSGLLDLESELVTFFERNKDRTSIIESCRQDLLTAIAAAQEQLDDTTDDPEAGQQRALAKARASVQTERERLTCNLMDEITRLRVASKPKAVSMVRDVVEGGKAKDIDESHVDAAASAIINNFGKCMEARLKEELEETKENLRGIGDKLSEASEWRAVDVTSTGVEIVGGSSTEVSAESEVSTVMKTAFKQMPKVNLEGVMEQGVKLALEKGKEWLPKLFKGIGPKTMGKWATTASRWAGPLVAVGTTIFEVYQVHRQEQEMKRKMERQIMATEDAADKFLNELCDSYTVQVRDVVTSVFTPVFDYLNEQGEAFASKQVAATEDQQQLDAAREMLTISN